jgi:antitoxin PrlF
MATTLQLESTLTDRYQTTVPASVRKALRLGKRTKLRYALQADGTVLLSRAPAESADDPVLGQFLGFLTKDIQARPGHIQAISPAWLKRMKSLVQGVKVNLDAPLDPSDE